MTRWLGRADFRTAKECPDCATRNRDGTPEYRCWEYFLADIVCAACCLKRHQTQPLHWIKVHHSFLITFQSLIFNDSFRSGLVSLSYLSPWRTWASRFNLTMPAFSARIPLPCMFHLSSNTQTAFMQSLSCIAAALKWFPNTCSFYVKAFTCLLS